MNTRSTLTSPLRDIHALSLQELSTLSTEEAEVALERAMTELPKTVDAGSGFQSSI